ncbi:SsrA-binding protein SmpB [Patescibacteria group bacterium]|nr:SsrA-binding protein SmpB [Patescibacteria group bacterium]MBU4512572.1 SsrA-binding protein SmpB [Patescibacteria group bacterium]MCG2692815.1 SsrA-binding protein SmpB [Candidatus Parcubacteria bacterium]
MLLATNKKAFHDYKILEKFEAGFVLTGPEVKSAKQGKIDFRGSYVIVPPNTNPQLVNCYIAPYPPALMAQKNYNPLRPRILLLNKKEINSLMGKSKNAGLTILPISIYTKHKLVKIEIALAQGKKKRDKREELKKRETERHIRRSLRQKY